MDKPRTDDAYKAYFDWCYSKSFPFVKVRNKVKYAVITVDMVTSQTRLNKLGQTQVEAFFRKYKPSGNMSIGSEICSIEDVLIKDSELVVEKILSIVTNQEYIENM